MARRYLQQRRRIIVYVVSMWCYLVQQAICLLLDCNSQRRSITNDDSEVPRPLPHEREVYRRGFLLNMTRANDVNCISMFRMSRRIFRKLCTVLQEAGGLARTKNVEVDEMVAMFLLTIGHNAKNRTCQVLFHRSGETVSRIIRTVLEAVLKLHTMLLVQPVPVPDNCAYHRWKYFKVVGKKTLLAKTFHLFVVSAAMAHDPTIEKGTRDYKQWSKTEEQMLVTCMRELVDSQYVEKGNFKMSELKTLERMMHSHVENCQLLAVPHIKSKVRYMKDKFAALVELKNASGFGWDDARGCVVADESIFSGWVKSHPKASGLNNKPLPYWDDLCVIFGSEMATGADAV
ncbi:hypothetical protein LINPERPRIM_LOCUS41272 [Linum perenne]